MNTKEILIAAKAKIADPKNWTRGFNARDANGEAIAPTHDRAVCWCAMGAIWRTVERSLDLADPNPAIHLLTKQIISLGHTTMVIPDYNDAYTHSEVIALFDKAIEMADKELVS